MTSASGPCCPQRSTLPADTTLRLWALAAMIKAGQAPGRRTSLPICMASVKEEAPMGRIMNSCIASELPAWLPPFMILKLGTGSTCSTQV